MRTLTAAAGLAVLTIGLTMGAGPARAHHGVASLGAAGLVGPGAPVETSSSATLPRGGFLVATKLDYAKFERKTAARDDESESNAFWMQGVGYGATSYLSLYLFAPFTTKKTEDNSYTTSGFTDISVTGVVGLKWDGGLKLVPANESLDDLEDLHFTLYGGGTLPTGDAEIRDAEGAIDPGMALGFGEPSVMFGATATRTFGPRVTVTLDGSIIRFQEHEYDDGVRTHFGAEARANAALSYRLLTSGAAKLRLDANLEGNYLHLGRDETDGVGESGTGGQIGYVIPGFRLYLKNTSLGVGVKFPAWTDLNEEGEQQGAEGTEDYRAIVTFSVLI